MCDEQGQLAIVGDVADGHPHARLGHSYAAVSDAALQRLVLESAIVLVNPQVLPVAVVGNVDVGPTAAREVRAENPPAMPRIIDAGRGGHVRERAVAVVVVECASSPSISSRPAVVRLPVFLIDA